MGGLRQRTWQVAVAGCRGAVCLIAGPRLLPHLLNRTFPNTAARVLGVLARLGRSTKPPANQRERGGLAPRARRVADTLSRDL